LSTLLSSLQHIQGLALASPLGLEVLGSKPKAQTQPWAWGRPGWAGGPGGRGAL